MARHKYYPRVNEYRGKNRIKEDWVKEQFGKEYELVWNGHSRFALDENTGEFFYIFKTLKYLCPINEFWQYRRLG